MAVNRRVLSTHFPFIPLLLELDHHVVRLEALVDTGFDGAIVVPADLVTDVELPPTYLRWKLADGSQVTSPAYRGTLQIGDMTPLRVTVTVLGDETIIGRAVTDRFRVTLDHGRQVIVEP